MLMLQSLIRYGFTVYAPYKNLFSLNLPKEYLWFQLLKLVALTFSTIQNGLYLRLVLINQRCKIGHY